MKSEKVPSEIYQVTAGVVLSERSGPVRRPSAGWKVSRLCWEVPLVILRLWQSCGKTVHKDRDALNPRSALASLSEPRKYNTIDCKSC